MNLHSHLLLFQEDNSPKKMRFSTAQNKGCLIFRVIERGVSILSEKK